MQRIAITGADGFVGRHVTRALREAGFTGEMRLFDRQFEVQTNDEGIALDLASGEAAEQVLDGADCVIHLAAMPGAQTECDPAGSRVINCDLSLALMERMEGRRLVLTSSIAVFGGALPDPVTDNTVPQPQSVYGTHKRMSELAFADAVRRDALNGFCLRLPGIVARPMGAVGFGSAFLSEIFHAAREGRPYTVPVGPDATTWLMSAKVCAQNIVHAALTPQSAPSAIMLPCLTVTIGDLTAKLAGGYSFAEDAGLRRTFGSYPPVETPLANSYGFRSDGSIEGLIANAQSHA